MGGRTGKRANPSNLCKCGGFALYKRKEFVTRYWRHTREGCAELPPTFPPGAAVYIDGRDLAKVKEAFPEGSTSYAFPHYRVDILDGDSNVAVRLDRVSVTRRGAP